MLWPDLQQQSMYANNAMFNHTDSNYPQQQQQQQQQQQGLFKQTYMNLPHYNNSVRTGSMSSSTEDDEDVIHQGTKRKASYSGDQDHNDEKRRNFLERNRQAALKCRQRKKQWLTNLQERVEYLTNDNEQLQMQANVMRDEVLSLRRLLMVHKDCPMTVQPPMYIVSTTTAAKLT